MAPGDTIEVRWGYAAITGMDHLGAEWGIKVRRPDEPLPGHNPLDPVLTYDDGDPLRKNLDAAGSYTIGSVS